MEKSEIFAGGGRNGTPGAGGGGRSRSRIGVVHSQPGSRSTSPTSLRSYHTYYDSQGTAAAGVACTAGYHCPGGNAAPVPCPNATTG